MQAQLITHNLIPSKVLSQQDVRHGIQLGVLVESQHLQGLYSSTLLHFVQAFWESPQDLHERTCRKAQVRTGRKSL